MARRRQELEDELKKFQSKNKPEMEEKKGISNIYFSLIIFILISIMAFSFFQLYKTNADYSDGKKEYEELKEEVVEQVREDAADTEEVTRDSVRKSAESNLVKENKLTAPIHVDFKTLKKKNSQILAWIYIEALDISYPVVQGEDNDYYLHRTIEGNYNFAGSIFMDWENTPDFKDCNTVIYGHNMADGSMFGKLKNITLEGAYNISPYLWILTEDNNYRYEIFSAQVVTVASDCYTLFNRPDENYLSFLERMSLNSGIQMGSRNFHTDNRVITLSTCTGDGTNQDRYVVQAVR
ncbi:class B sortase [Robinsoniella peoriensis]